MGLPVRVAPFPIMEAQAAAIVHAFANPASLDLERESRDLLMRYDQLGAPFDGNPAAIARIWSIFEEQEQFDYRTDYLHSRAKTSAYLNGEKICTTRKTC